MNKKKKLVHNILYWHYNNNNTHFFLYKNDLIPEGNHSKNLKVTNKIKLNNNFKEEEITDHTVKSNTLEELKLEIENFSGCSLKKTATNLVFADGNSKAKVMLIGEAPGEEEDKTGKPFKGQAGVLLDKMLNAIEQNRKNTYISNVIFWRPPGNRNPTEEEIKICLPFVLKHIELINPRILILAGAIATKAILKEDKGIIQLRGKWHDLSLNNSDKIKTMPIFHPAFLLRQPSRKKDAWEDLKKIKKEIELIT
ncbi:MAG: hypothetical protein CFH34_00826 [Alphaproteobacteria bacterium MarineAlpha9_Bin4]|nr:MAG: hypothetical protein CFH34_00826 [Alphaproteobacteria bacterium MarineAlpha9_Bin4]